MSVIGLRLDLVNNKGARVRVHAEFRFKNRAMVRFVINVGSQNSL